MWEDVFPRRTIYIPTWDHIGPRIVADSVILDSYKAPTGAPIV